MAYQKKYYFQFVSADDKTNIVELWQDTATTLTAIEVKTMGMPFAVEMPDLDGKFQAVRGTGCEINLLSETNMQFFTGLYHTDKKEFMVKHYIDGTINWLGYLNSEMNRESYGELTNYPVSVSGNDGFSLIDRFQFLQGVEEASPGAIYEGIKSQWDILRIILKRIGLPYEYVYFNLSTTFTGYSEVLKTIMHQTYVDCGNFYDEEGVAMTMREVLEAILKPYAAFITQVGGNIYITDINSLATGTDITWKRVPFVSGVVTNLSGTILYTEDPSIARSDKFDLSMWDQGNTYVDIHVHGYTHTFEYTGHWTSDLNDFITLYSGGGYGAVTITTTHNKDLIFTSDIAGVDFVDTSTASDAAVVITTLAANHEGSKVYQITLTGTSGQADITVNGYTHRATFNFDLNTTATDYVSAFQGLHGAVTLSSPYSARILFTHDNPLFADFVGVTSIINVEASEEFTDVVIDPVQTISSIGYAGSGGDIEISGGKNKQSIKYSPYPNKYLLQPCLKEAEEWETIPAYSGSNIVVSGNKYLNSYAPAFFQFGNNSPYDLENKYSLVWARQSTSIVVADMKINPEIVIKPAISQTEYSVNRIVKGVGVRISGKVYFASTNALPVTKINLNISIGVGNKIADSVTNGFVVGLPGTYNYIAGAVSTDAKTIAGKWNNITHSEYAWTIPVNTHLSGEINVNVYSNFRAELNNTGTWYENPTWITGVKLSEFSVDLVDLSTYKELPSHDLEYIGYLDSSFKDEAEKVELICGTEATFSDNGKMMYKAADIYYPIATWIRGGNTYTIEQLLLNSLVSNCQMGYYTLSNLKLRNKFNQIGTIQDSYTGSKVFMIKSIKTNYRDDEIDATIVEITPDTLTINT